MVHGARQLCDAARFLEKRNGCSVSEAVQSLLGRDEVALGFVACPQALEIVWVEGGFSVREDVGAVPPPLEVRNDIVRNGDGSDPSVFCSGSTQRDELTGHVDVATGQHSDFAMRPEQAAIGEKATQVEVGIVSCDVVQYRFDIVERLVQEFLGHLLRDGPDGVGHRLWEYEPEKGGQVLPFVIVGGGSRALVRQERSAVVPGQLIQWH